MTSTTNILVNQPKNVNAQSKLESALALAKRGFRVFPLRPNTKSGQILKSWLTEATSDPKQIRQWWTVDPDRNIGLVTTGFLVADLDIKNGKLGVESFESLGLEMTSLTFQTASGGYHIIYDSGTDYANAVDLLGPGSGLDIRSRNGYIVGPGSTIDGQRYEVFHDSEIELVPEVLDDLLKSPGARGSIDRGTSDDSDEAIAQGEHYLQHNAPIAVEGQGGNATTYRVACELVRDLGLSEDAALDLMLYSGWNERCLPPWDESELSVIVEHASAYGTGEKGSKTSSAVFGDLEEIAEAIKVEEPAGDADSFVKKGGATKRLVTLESLNERYAILQAPGAASVYVSRADFQPIQDVDFKRRLAPEVVLIGRKDEAPIYAPAFQVWSGDAKRHVYRRIAFTSGALPDDTLNLYRGLGVTPKAGNCDPILTHIREVICAGDATVADAMVRLLAWQIQNIGKPSRTVVVLKSERQQAGKGILLGSLMAKIYGPSGFVPSTMDQVIGRFNDAIRGVSFAFLDEVLFGGDRRAADQVKSLSTCQEIGIETKGLPIVRCPIAINLWLASNHENAAHIEESDARYWVLDVSEHRIGDHRYFRALTSHIESGGREAFAHYLLNLDVSDFVPWRDVPKQNQAKRAMIRQSINPYDARKWLEECCHTEGVLGLRCPATGKWRSWREGDEYTFGELAAAYTEWQKGVKTPIAAKPTPVGRLGEVIGDAGMGVRRTAAGNRRALPSVQVCLRNLGAEP